MNEFTKLLVWQMAQILGYEGQKDLSEHALLLLVDYDADTFFPVFIGKRFEVKDFKSDVSWSESVHFLVTHVIAEEHSKETSLFLSEQAARRKFEKNRVYDSSTYISLLTCGKKWTHCIQSLFTSSEPIHETAEKLRSEMDFSGTTVIFPESSPCPAPEKPHLMSYFLIIEVDAIRKSQESLRYLARHDQLTGLFNRHMMSEIVNDDPAVVIIIDIDKFKGINDTFGHAAGDKVLCTLASRLEAIFWHRERDMIFRLGGDEFLVVMKGASEQAAVSCLKQLCEPVTLTDASNRPMTFSVSAGYAFCNGNFKAALSAADKALYTAKANGRNGYTHADS